MNSEIIILVVQIIAALGVVISVIYLGVQIHQQNEITKAQFGHSLTQRQYERYRAKYYTVGIEQESKAINVAYTVGGLTLALQDAKTDNAAYVSGDSDDVRTISVKTAF